MKPLVRANLIPVSEAQMAALIEQAVSAGIDRKDAETFINKERQGDIWKNELYTVIMRERPNGMVHLSIRRNDRSAARDWRHFQQIKDQLLGPEEEAIELYPSRSRLVDSANQYHLWCQRGFQIPFGFVDGFTSSSCDPATGAVQRPFES